MKRLSDVIRLVLLGVLFAPSATAQEVENVAELNSRAVAALERGEYERAERLLERAIAQAPLNILYLNLGRTYARWGKCEEAREAYDAVPEADPVSNPPADRVLKTLYEYRQELDEACAQPPPATQRPVVEAELPEPSGSEPEPRRAPIFPIVLGGTGAALVVTGIVLDQTVVSNGIEELEAAQAEDDEDDFGDLRRRVKATQVGTIVLVGTGAAAMAVGTIWFLLDASERGVVLRPFVTSEGVGVAWEIPF